MAVSERSLALRFGGQELLDAAAALAVKLGAQIQVRTESMIAGSVRVAPKPGWGKTMALGVVGVVPAVLYRTLGSKESEHGFAFTVATAGNLTVLKAAGHGAGLDLIGEVMDTLENRFSDIGVANVEQFWEWLYETVDGFDRSQRELQTLLEAADLAADHLESWQIHCVAESGWATEDGAASDLAVLTDVLVREVNQPPSGELFDPETHSPDVIVPSPPDLNDAGAHSPARRLADLSELLDAGLIDEAEYQSQRQRILDSL